MPTETTIRTTILNETEFSLGGPELQVGDDAPDFDVVTSSLQPFSLGKSGSGVRIFSVVPSLDTPVCDAQTKRFEDETEKLPALKVFTVSMDLPFAQSRWCSNYGVSNVVMLSDHRGGSFGEHYGTLIRDLRIESRAIFVIDKHNKLVHVEYVRKVADHPDYEAALEAAKRAVESDEGT